MLPRAEKSPVLENLRSVCSVTTGLHLVQTVCLGEYSLFNMSQLGNASATHKCFNHIHNLRAYFGIAFNYAVDPARLKSVNGCLFRIDSNNYHIFT